jgi:pimeloyl-ACP methyl ester carboxylesterase
MKFSLILILASILVFKTSGNDIHSFKSFDGVKIAYTDEGKGSPVILIHGFMSSGADWSRSALKQSLLQNGYRVIIPDLRGNGNSDKPHNDEAYANDAEIKDLKALADHLKLKKYMAIGYSRGSIVLAKLLTQDSRIRKAVLGGMGLDFTNPEWDRRKMFAAAFDENAVLTDVTAGAVNAAKSKGADLRALHLMQKYQPVTSIGELKKVKTRTLVIAGDQDKDNGNPGELQQYLPNSTLKIVSGKHGGTANTAAFADAVLSFLKDQ